MRFLPAAAFALIISLSPCIASPYSANSQNSSDVDRKPVVVELFTSEGCSSCPPADVILQKLAAEQPVPGAQIIPLEEHVDYWNHDGWADPYSSPEWTARQASYAALVKKDPYTPELVVDGQTEFVGSNPKEAVLAIEDAARNPKTEIAISVAESDAKSARFSVSAGKLVGNTTDDVAEVWLAVTEDGLHSSVSRGENAGHELNHVATLRWLHKLGVANANGASTSFTSDPVVKFNPRWNVDHLHVVVFLQQKKSRQIIGAASTRVKS